MRSNFERLRGDRGFTLIEVLIVMVLLVVISLGVFQAITTTYRLRDSLANDGDFHNGIRLAMGIIEEDFSATYDPRIMLPKPSPSATPAPTNAYKAQANEPQTTLFWGPLIDPTGVRQMRFIGEPSKMSFISTSNTRIYRNARESVFRKVIFETRAEKRTPQDPNLVGTQALVQTVSPNAFSEDDDRDEYKKEYLLIHGIKKFVIRYLKRARTTSETDQWLTRWDSVEMEDTRGRIPDMIEIKLEVAGRSRLFFEGTYKFRTEIPSDGIRPTL